MEAFGQKLNDYFKFPYKKFLINGYMYSYCYDPNGNRTHNHSYDCTVCWNSFNKAKRIKESWLNWSEFIYDTNLTRSQWPERFQ